jgi:hypothetical protein
LSQTDIDFEDLLPDLVSVAFPNGVRQGQDDFHGRNDMDFPNLEDIIGYEAFEGFSSDAPGQLNFLDQGFQEVETNWLNPSTLVNAASQVTAFQLDNVVDSMPGAPPLLVEGTLQPQLNQSLPADSSESNQVNGRSEGAMQPTMMPFGTFPQHIPIPLQTPMVPVQAQSFPLNADEKLSCNHLGCENAHFERKCDWQ